MQGRSRTERCTATTLSTVVLTREEDEAHLAHSFQETLPQHFVTPELLAFELLRKVRKVRADARRPRGVPARPALTLALGVVRLERVQDGGDVVLGREVGAEQLCVRMRRDGMCRRSLARTLAMSASNSAMRGSSSSRIAWRATSVSFDMVRVGTRCVGIP
jgi:hypothetical protein